ncbi:MAG: hypothetical protein AB7L90_10085 [Hyphomicrobiaceae bacterium]
MDEHVVKRIGKALSKAYGRVDTKPLPWKIIDALETLREVGADKNLSTKPKGSNRTPRCGDR